MGQICEDVYSLAHLGTVTIIFLNVNTKQSLFAIFEMIIL